MTKTCSQCEVERDISNFFKTKKNNGKYYQPMCKICNKERYGKKRRDHNRLWRVQKPDRLIESTRNQAAKRYGVSREYYEKCMASSTTCEICGVAANGKELSYDHCHTTGKFRGLLCNKCNMAIGQLGDNLEGLLKAVKYLTKDE